MASVLKDKGLLPIPHYGMFLDPTGIVRGPRRLSGGGRDVVSYIFSFDFIYSGLLWRDWDEG